MNATRIQQLWDAKSVAAKEICVRSQHTVFCESMNATRIQQLWDQRSVAAKEIYVSAARAENEAADNNSRREQRQPVMFHTHQSLLHLSYLCLPTPAISIPESQPDPSSTAVKQPVSPAQHTYTAALKTPAPSTQQSSSVSSHKSPNFTVPTVPFTNRQHPASTPLPTTQAKNRPFGHLSEKNPDTFIEDSSLKALVEDEATGTTVIQNDWEKT